MEASDAWTKAIAVASMGTNRLSGRVARARGPMAARHSRLRVPLLLVPAVVLRLPDRCDGELRGAAAGGGGSAVSVDRLAPARRRARRFHRLRLGLSVRISPGFARQNHHLENQPAVLDRLPSLPRSGGIGDSSAADFGLQRHSV